MSQRIDSTKYQSSAALLAMLSLQREVDTSGLEPSLLHLVKIRVSQINGCAYCIDMHTKDARAAGETEQRIYGLNAWGEAPYYSARERAALDWAENVTLLHQTHVPDELYERVRKEFSEAETVSLTFALIAINGWNRLAVSFRAPAGTYKPRAVAV